MDVDYPVYSASTNKIFHIFLPFRLAKTKCQGLVLRKGENDHPPSRLRREVRK